MYGYRGGKTSSDSPLYITAEVGLSHRISASLGLVSQAVFKLAPCCPSNMKDFQVNYQRFKAPMSV